MRNAPDVLFAAKPDGTVSAGKSRAASARRVRLLAAVIAAHSLLAWGITQAPTANGQPAGTEPLVAVYMRPLVVVGGPESAPKPRFVVPRDAPILPELAPPDVDPPIVTVVGVGTLPPALGDPLPDSAAFARDAGLLTGEGVTVVLRLEVLGSGDLDHIMVEVSGGNDRLDEAAIAYARALPWTGGMVDGRPQTLWIRWGVRLQA